MDAEEVEHYLERIGFDRPITADHETLAALQLAHLRAAPFENLDVVAGESMAVEEGWSIPKVVGRRRGGWCFELNGAFAALLEATGFDVDRLPALVFMGGDNPSPMDDHLCLRVHLDRPWLVDVGFGDSFTQPLALDRGEPVDDTLAGRRFRLTTGVDRHTLWSEHDGEWRRDYEFATTPVDLAHFEPAARFLSTEPGLPWAEKRFLTRLTETGRVTLLEKRLRIVSDGEIDEVEVESEEQWRALAREWFGHG
ncbi:MAG: arylamine N-acetyltransferase [Actinomycetia bacterium]|nr:arylamine N-acetyltransferase [Actinomycetes bacterium]